MSFDYSANCQCVVGGRKKVEDGDGRVHASENLYDEEYI